VLEIALEEYLKSGGNNIVAGNTLKKLNLLIDYEPSKLNS
jgi:hypothetical protein